MSDPQSQHHAREVARASLPDPLDDDDLVATQPSDEPAPDERQPPPETIWGAI